MKTTYTWTSHSPLILLIHETSMTVVVALLSDEAEGRGCSFCRGADSVDGIPMVASGVNIRLGKIFFCTNSGRPFRCTWSGFNYKRSATRNNCKKDEIFFRPRNLTYWDIPSERSLLHLQHIFNHRPMIWMKPKRSPHKSARIRQPTAHGQVQIIQDTFSG